MAKFFNIAGPCDPGRHYMVSPIPRLVDFMQYIDDEQYFVVHAPRQSGKTTALNILAQHITAEGKYTALHFSCESAGAAGNDNIIAQIRIINSINAQAEMYLPEELRPPVKRIVKKESLLQMFLTDWSKKSPRPLVLFFDEIDSMIDNTLLTILRSIRERYLNRPKLFPMSIVLCGMRDVRDYKMLSGGNETNLGTASPFNIKVDSFRLVDFTLAEVTDLYLQHTKATGQEFTTEAIESAFYFSKGQPWLVNNIANKIIKKMKITETITKQHVEESVKLIISARETHLDSLVDKLHENRVRKIIQPILAGELYLGDENFNDDLLYARDLGIVNFQQPPEISNPIYKEVVSRVLADKIQETISIKNLSFLNPDGSINIDTLLTEFMKFWVRNGGILSKNQVYHEVAAQLIFMAFLHRVINGGGLIDREYAIDSRRIDLLLRWPLPGAKNVTYYQQEIFELKVKSEHTGEVLQEGLEQIEEYIVLNNQTTGTLIIFDRSPNAPDIHTRSSISTATTPKHNFTVRLLHC